MKYYLDYSISDSREMALSMKYVTSTSWKKLPQNL